MNGRKLFYFLSALLVLFAASSCSKENVEPAPKTPEQYLTSKSWKLQELRSLISNTTYFYQRGSSNALNFNYDSESIQFKADYTGIYRGKDGDVTPFTWSFIDAGKTRLRYLLQRTPVLTINWEIAVLDDFKLIYNEYYTQGSANAQSYGTRIPLASF